MDTEIGKIASMLKGNSEIKTNLQEKMDSLSKTLAISVTCISLVIFLVGLIYNMPILSIFMLSVSLAVSAIPEGLPTTTTIVLAFGVQRLAKHNAIIKHLPAVETLGSATVIASDKTGTLTENKIKAIKIYYDDEIVNIDYDKQNINDNETFKRLVIGMMLCNDAKISKEGLVGDPTEVALAEMGFALRFYIRSFFMV